MSRRGGRGGGGYRGNRTSSDANNAVAMIQEKKGRQPCCEEILKSFSSFKRDIDDRNDRWERMVKLSRDVTIESKRVIFLLHRLCALPDDACRKEEIEKLFREADERLCKLREEKFKCVAMEMQLEDPNDFLSSYRPGLQEYIEAVSLLHYLKTDQLVTWRDIQESLRFAESATDQSATSILSVEVPLIDYLCGIGDLTGELMRLAIGYASTGNFRKPEEIRAFLVHVYRGFVLLGHAVNSKDFAFKLRVAKQNLEKVENACYMLNLRMTEVPQDMLAEVMTNLFAAPNHHGNDGQSSDMMDQSDM